MSVLVPAKSPGLSAVFMAAAVSILLLFVARILFLFVRLWSRPTVRPESQEKASSSLSMSFVSNSRGRSLHWNTLPASLPFALTLSEKPSSRVGNGVGVGLSHKRSQSLPVIVWQPRTGPQFQPPREYSRPWVSVPRLSIATVSTCALRESDATLNGKDDHVAARKQLVFVLADTFPHFCPPDISPTKS
ncbi:hypothetical protein J3R82DRAFT_8104 [Butyriboletus roseoflavus]|nr:hypothetical protein J3R82DRAFT_8104 [Butyriboletus roseoflavus]